MSQLADKITFHHTAGTYTANELDCACYHYLIDDKGNIIKGKYTVLDNANCYDGAYAKHCGGGNTKNIGIAYCANFGLTEAKLTTPYPLTRVQLEAGFKLAAELCVRYKIPIKPENIFTHYEFDQRKTHPEGKIDIIYLPPFPFIKREEIGNFIRNKVQWYRDHFIEYTLV